MKPPSLSLPFRRPRSAHAAGLAFDGRAAHLVFARTDGSTITPIDSRTFPFPVDQDAPDAESAAVELRRQVEECGIREARWAIRLPASWLITARAEVPEMDAQDLPGFLELTAERELPLPPSDLARASSIVRHNDSRSVTFAAVPRARFAWLQEVLANARIRPATISCGWAGADDARGAVYVAAEDGRVGLQITLSEGTLLIRSIPFPADTDAATSRRVLAREFRLALGQLPPALLDRVRQVRLLGTAEELEPIREAVRETVEGIGLAFTAPPHEPTGLPAAAGTRSAWHAIEDLTARRAPDFEFLPPREHPWRRRVERFASRGHRVGVGIAVGLVTIAILAFFIQGRRLSGLESRWSELEPTFVDLEGLQDRIRKYRSWFSAQPDTLDLLHRLTLEFPETGEVWARTLNIQDQTEVVCSGIARDNQAFLDLLDRLRSSARIRDLAVQQVQARDGIQFAFAYSWEDNARE